MTAGRLLAQAGRLGVPWSLRPDVNLLWFVFSAGIGVLFGYFRERRAAHMDPIETLRPE